MSRRGRPRKRDRLLSTAEVGALLAEHFEVPSDPKRRSEWVIRAFRRLEARDGERYLRKLGSGKNAKMHVSLLALEKALPFDPGTQQTIARQVHENSEEIRRLRWQFRQLKLIVKKMREWRLGVPQGSAQVPHEPP